MTKVKEVWKSISGYEGYYEASSLGKIRGVSRTIPHPTWGTRNLKGVVRKTHRMKNRRLVVSLTKFGKSHTYLVSRLVAKTWIPNPFNKSQINHLDADQDNNAVTNLEWATQKENTAHAMANGLIPKGDIHSATKITDAQIAEIRKSKLHRQQLAKRFNCTPNYINSIKRYADRP